MRLRSDARQRAWLSLLRLGLLREPGLAVEQDLLRGEVAGVDARLREQAAAEDQRRQRQYGDALTHADAE